MDDQALVEGSVVFKDEDDPAEESQLAEQAWCLESCRLTTAASFLLTVSALAQNRHFLLDPRECAVAT